MSFATLGYTWEAAEKTHMLRCAQSLRVGKGVLERWSNGVMYSNPILQCSNTPLCSARRASEIFLSSSQAEFSEVG